MGLFFYTKKGSIISTVDLPTTEIIEPEKPRSFCSTERQINDEDQAMRSIRGNG